MRRNTEKKIAKGLKQWAQLRSKKERIEADRDQKLEPIRTRFEQRCAPINSAANEELEPIALQMAQLEQQISVAFLHEIEELGNTNFRYVDTATAVAEVVARTERELDAKTFFESVPPQKRNEAFWSCLKTLIGKAEKFLGAIRLNELAHAQERLTVSIKAK
jgi:hypothetical protein